MKRELAALEIDSPVLKSIGGKTRSSNQRSGVESERLVYKRTKRSLVQVEEVDVRSIRSNGVAGDSKDSIGGVGNLSVVDNFLIEPKGTPAVREEREIGVSGVTGEVEYASDEGVHEPSSMEMVDKGVNDGHEINVVGISMEDNGTVSNLSAEDNALMNSVQTENGELSNVCREVIMGEIASGTLSLCPSNLVSDDLRNLSVERFPRRFTRSALKSKADTLTEPIESVVPYGDLVDGALIKRNAEVGEARNFSTIQLIEDNGVSKNSSAELRGLTCDSVSPDEKNIKSVPNDGNAEPNIPSTVMELLETGLLEGCPVYYNDGKVPKLRGRIQSIGILCSCGLCQERRVIPPSLFEIHARKSYKRAAQYIFLVNGRNFIQILKECKNTHLSSVEASIQNAIGPLPERKLVDCQNCREPFSTMDAESSEAVCSSCVMSNLSSIGPVFSYRKTCRSFKYVRPSRLSRAVSSRGMLHENQEKLIEKSPDASLKLNLQSSPRSPEESCVRKLRSSPRFGKSSEAKTTFKTMKKSSKVSLTPNLRSSPRFEKSSEAKITKKTGKIAQEILMVPKTHDSPRTGKSSETRICEKPMNKLSGGPLSPNLSGSIRLGKSPKANYHWKTMKRLKKDLTLKRSKSPSVRGSSVKKTCGKITRKDLRQHKLVFEDDILPDGTELGYYARGQKLLDGYKKGSGIFCSCCSTVVSASLFEAHAGFASRRKPYCYIYTSNGVSLHELSVILIKVRTQSTKFNDDLCSICADGGNLLLCDGCPRSFHMHCASLPSIPRDKWYCKYCKNMFEREKFVAYNANAVAAGRVSGIDPIEQITERSIRIVDSLASEVSSCILCRGYDFCKSGFGPRTIILCDQCEKEYHVGCLKDRKMADLTELPEGKWFCSMDCGRIDSALQNLLARGAEKLPELLLNIIQQKHTQTDSECATDFDLSWRLLSGKVTSAETRPLLSQAVAIFHECFAPILDTVSGRDLIPAMVYGRNVAGQEYGGMFCAVLTVNSVVVSAGIFRVFGPEVAELPLVATSTDNHGKGYFQALFACIEDLLGSLKVQSFVLPAAEEAESIWTDRFGFRKMTPDQLCEFKRNYWSMVRFQGTSMLHKLIPEGCVIQS